MSEEFKKSVEDTMKSDEFKKMLNEDNNAWWWFIMLLLLFAFPFGSWGSNDAMHYDKQTIAYQQGLIDAYEKMMEG